jgi:hypothetical protein
MAVVVGIALGWSEDWQGSVEDWTAILPGDYRLIGAPGLCRLSCPE